MPDAACPKCHRRLPDGAICCAEVRCMWRCRRCFKLTTGFAIPYGRCRLCDGELQMFTETDIYGPEAERLWAVRQAVQAELDAFLFYTRWRATSSTSWRATRRGIGTSAP